jgi:hypothetical protein
MRINQLRKFQLRQPFEPFVVQLIDGQRFQVRQPDAIAVEDKTRSVSILNVAGEIQVIDALHVLLLRDLTTQEKKALR